MSEKSKRLKEIEERLEEIKPILTKTFKTSKELNSHVSKFKDLYDEGKSLSEEAELLQYELMTPEEKKKHNEFIKWIELKSKVEPFDFTQFE